MLLLALEAMGAIIFAIIMVFVMKRGCMAFSNAALARPKAPYLAEHCSTFHLGKRALLIRVLKRILRRRHKIKPQKTVECFHQIYPHIYPGAFVKLKEGTRYDIPLPGSILWIGTISLDERITYDKNFVPAEVSVFLVDKKGYAILDTCKIWADDVEALTEEEQSIIDEEYKREAPHYEPLPDGTVVDIEAESLIVSEDQLMPGAPASIARIREPLYGIVDRPDTTQAGKSTTRREAKSEIKGEWYVCNIATLTMTRIITKKLSLRMRRCGPEYQVFVPAYKGLMPFDRSQIRPHIFDRSMFENVVMDQDVREKLLRFSPAKNVARLAEWGVGEGLLQEKNNIALFMGALGGGKTLTARALAEYLEMPFYPFDSADLANGLENALRTIATRAKRWHALVLWDEADIFLEQRLLFIGGATPATSVVLQYIENFEGGMLIIATNRQSVIDEGINSRIPLKVYFPAPDKTRRAQIWRAHISSKMPIEPELTDGFIDELAQIELDGRQIRNAVVMAARYAANAGLNYVPREKLKEAAMQIKLDAQEMRKDNVRTKHRIGFETEAKPRP